MKIPTQFLLPLLALLPHNLHATFKITSSRDNHCVTHNLPLQNLTHHEMEGLAEKFNNEFLDWAFKKAEMNTYRKIENEYDFSTYDERMEGKIKKANKVLNTIQELDIATLIPLHKTRILMIQKGFNDLSMPCYQAFPMYQDSDFEAKYDFYSFMLYLFGIVCYKKKIHLSKPLYCPKVDVFTTMFLQEKLNNISIRPTKDKPLAWAPINENERIEAKQSQYLTDKNIYSYFEKAWCIINEIINSKSDRYKRNLDYIKSLKKITKNLLTYRRIYDLDIVCELNSVRLAIGLSTLYAEKDNLRFYLLFLLYQSQFVDLYARLVDMYIDWTGYDPIHPLLLDSINIPGIIKMSDIVNHMIHPERVNNVIRYPNYAFGACDLRSSFDYRDNMLCSPLFEPIDNKRKDILYKEPLDTSKIPTFPLSILIQGYYRQYIGFTNGDIYHILKIIEDYFYYNPFKKNKQKLGLKEDLSRQNYAGYNFTGCHFTKTNLTGTKLEKAILTKTVCDYRDCFRQICYDIEKEYNFLSGAHIKDIYAQLRAISLVYPSLSHNQKVELLYIANGLVHAIKVPSLSLNIKNETIYNMIQARSEYWLYQITKFGLKYKNPLLKPLIYTAKTGFKDAIDRNCYIKKEYYEKNSVEYKLQIKRIVKNIDNQKRAYYCYLIGSKNNKEEKLKELKDKIEDILTNLVSFHQTPKESTRSTIHRLCTSILAIYNKLLYLAFIEIDKTDFLYNKKKELKLKAYNLLFELIKMYQFEREAFFNAYQNIRYKITLLQEEFGEKVTLPCLYRIFEKI